MSVHRPALSAQALSDPDALQMSTFLAYKQLANETDCTGSLTWDEWEWWLPNPPAHPKTYPAPEINGDLLWKIRAHDDSACGDFVAAIGAARRLFTTAELLLVDASLADVGDQCELQGSQAVLMKSFCSVFARKFKEDAAPAVLEAMLEMTPNISVFQQPISLQESLVCTDSTSAFKGQQPPAKAVAASAESTVQQQPSRHI